MQKFNKSFMTSLLLSTSFLASNVAAQILPDVNINLTTPFTYNSDYVGFVVSTPINTINLNISNGNFKQSVYGNKVGIGTNSNLSFSGGVVAKDMVGLERSLLELGKINVSNTINVSGGSIKGNVLATKDKAGYTGTDQRTSNNINFSGGTIGGNIEGGAGAAKNTILVTGGTLKNAFTTNSEGEECEDYGGICGTNKVGTIYAGTSNAAAVNKSVNASVILKDMNNTNSFLSSFVQGAGNEGLIIGSNITGVSNLNFDGVNGNYQGGFKDFDVVNFSEKSSTNTATNVKLTGSTYKADVWNVNGILDTNGKTLTAYKNSVSGLALNVGTTGKLLSQFISDVKVLANNAGIINGIKSVGKQIDLTNSGTASGSYEGDIVNIINTGTISGTTSISSANTLTAGALNNSGTVTGNLSLTGNVVINNQNSGNINNGNITNNQDTLNINNNGTMSGNNTVTNSTDAKTTNINNGNGGTVTGSLTVKDGTLNLNNLTGSAINGYDMIADSATLNINNQAMISGTNTIENKGTGEANLTNYSNGTVTGSLALKGGSLDLSNLGDGNLKDLTLKADAGTINVANSGAISGSNIIENTNNGVINLANNLGANLTGSLDVKSGLGTFTNAGRIDTLALTNEQTNLTLDNSGLMMGNNSFTNTLVGNTITVNNKADAGITGTLSSTGGNFNLNNAVNAIISDLNYTNISSNAAITNAGTINNSSIKNMLAAQMNLNNTGLISGVGDWRNVNLNNQTGGVVQSATITSIDNGVVNIANSGTFNGNNILNSTGNGTFTFNNAVDGTINGGLTVNGGLNALANAGVIENLVLTSNVADFKVNNTGTVTGNNALVSATETVTLNNTGTGTVGGNLTLNAPVVNLNQESTGVFNVALGSQNANTVLNIKNDTDLTASLAGGLKDVNLVNNNTTNTDAHLTLANLGNISGDIKIDNDGYIKIDNQGTIGVGVGSGGVISDETTPAVPLSSCLVNTVELNNSGRIDNDMSVMNNIFKLTNTGTGYIDSNHIDTRDLRLTNAGIFDSDVSYLFSVQDHMNVVNSGSIYGRDMAFKLTGDKVTGTIENTGTIYSQGTTIGYGPDPLVPCPDCYLDGDNLTINNSGRIVAVDVATLTNPDLNSHAVSADNAVVNNLNGGLIGGSVHVKEYNQKAGATWVTFMNKDLSQMSTIIAEDKISIENGSVLTIYTNNDVKAFTNNQQFRLVEAKGMNQDQIDAQIENFTIHTDSPFANYQMIAKNNDEGYIVFNHVAPTTYATATDLATASHNNTILGSQRMYELFVNRDINQVEGMSSGDSFKTTNKLNFMPIGGVAHQGDKDGHAGYDTNYYGGIGYFEHDFNNNLKGGLGFAYMNNSTDFNDSYNSDGKIDSYRPFAYINYELNNWRVDLAGGVAKHKVDNTRKYAFNNTIYNSKGKYDADEISGHLNIGYKFDLENNWTVQPIIGAYAAKLKTDTFDEKGTGPMNMNVKSEDYDSFKSMVGMKFSKEYALESGATVKPELHVRWYRELGDRKGGVSVYFLAQEQLFNTSGIESPKDIGDIALRVTTKSGTEYDLFAEAYYQFGSKFYNAGGTVGMQYNF